jgi:hypothetical protein
MKKIVLSLAGIMAAVAFAPEASAVPVFARQTGMACSACHFQHFPLLNGFGRAFKAAGFTMMGAQGKVEGEHLDIPDRVNMGVFTTTFFETQSAGQTAGVGNAVATPKWGTPGTGGELSLFVGGRASEFAGFLTEFGAGGAGVPTVPLAAAAKLALLFPVGDARIGAVIHSSQGQGVAYSFELLNTGAANTHKIMGKSGPASQHVKAFSAAQYLGTNTAATGISVVANNSMGFIVLGAYEAAGNNLVGGANTLPLTYVRAAATIDVAGFDAGFGIQSFGGTSYVLGTSAKATVIDAQLQGELGAMPAGFYASYGTAPAGTAALAGANLFNANSGVGTTANTSLNVAAEVGVIPHVATVQVAARLAKQGNAAVAGVTAANLSDNALMLGVTYELAQNIGLSLTRTQQSGGVWNTTAAGTTPVGKTATTLLLETLF